MCLCARNPSLQLSHPSTTWVDHITLSSCHVRWTAFCHDSLDTWGWRGVERFCNGRKTGEKTLQVSILRMRTRWPTFVTFHIVMATVLVKGVSILYIIGTSRLFTAENNQTNVYMWDILFLYEYRLAACFKPVSSMIITLPCCIAFCNYCLSFLTHLFCSFMQYRCSTYQTNQCE